MFFLFIGLQEFLVHWSVCPLVYWSIGPLVECQISKVNKVRILSERTSGVPPVIFILLSIQSLSFVSNVSDKVITYGTYVVALIHCTVNLCEWCMVANYS